MSTHIEPDDLHVIENRASFEARTHRTPVLLDAERRYDRIRQREERLRAAGYVFVPEAGWLSPEAHRDWLAQRRAEERDPWRLWYSPVGQRVFTALVVLAIAVFAGSAAVLVDMHYKDVQRYASAR